MKDICDTDNICKKCGSLAYYKYCWKCGGCGGMNGKDLIEEDSLWCSPDNFEICDECNGAGSFKICSNKSCAGE